MDRTCTLQGTAWLGVRVPPCKNVGSSGADSGVRRSRIYRGCVALKRGAARLEGKGGTREDEFLRRALPIVPSFLSAPSPPIQPRRQGRREAGARFYDDRGEGQGGAYVHHDDTGKTSGWERMGAGERGDITVFASFSSGPPMCRNPRGMRPAADPRDHASHVADDGSSWVRRALSGF